VNESENIRESGMVDEVQFGGMLNQRQTFVKVDDPDESMLF
jgi:hypothetical protein